MEIFSGVAGPAPGGSQSAPRVESRRRAPRLSSTSSRRCLACCGARRTPTRSASGPSRRRATVGRDTSRPTTTPRAPRVQTTSARARARRGTKSTSSRATRYVSPPPPAAPPPARSPPDPPRTSPRHSRRHFSRAIATLFLSRRATPRRSDDATRARPPPSLRPRPVALVPSEFCPRPSSREHAPPPPRTSSLPGGDWIPPPRDAVFLAPEASVRRRVHLFRRRLRVHHRRVRRVPRRRASMVAARGGRPRGGTRRARRRVQPVEHARGSRRRR